MRCRGRYSTLDRWVAAEVTYRRGRGSSPTGAPDLNAVIRRTMISEVAKKLVEAELLLVSDSELVQWAIAELERCDEPDSDLAELASLRTATRADLKPAQFLLRSAISRLDPEFDLRSPAAEAHAKRAFLRHCHRLIAAEISPYTFCRVVGPIEHCFGHPRWLADFYSCCDCCEPESTRHQFDHLVEYAERYVEASAV